MFMRVFCINRKGIFRQKRKRLPVNIPEITKQWVKTQMLRHNEPMPATLNLLGALCLLEIERKEEFAAFKEKMLPLLARFERFFPEVTP
jgi:hypothetical protein